MKETGSKTSKLRTILICLIVVCVAAIGYSAYRLYDIQAEYKKGEQLYAGLRSEVSENLVLRVRKAEEPAKVIISKAVVSGEESPTETMLRLMDGELVVEEWVSGAEPHQVEAPLEAGKTYTLMEANIPASQTTAQPIEITVSGAVAEGAVEIESDSNLLKLTKEIITGEAELPGATLKVMKGDAIVEEWVSGNIPHEIIAQLFAGQKYTLVQETSVNGFVVAEAIDFSVSFEPADLLIASEDTPFATSQMDFAKLEQINPDTVAWITIEDTLVDYPVVQGSDNRYYLKHLFTGEYGTVGSIFMEKTNTPDFSDQNTLIFGHNMKDKSMFADLDKYREQEYYEEHPTMMLFTPQGDHLVEWFAGYTTTSAPLPLTFETEDEFEEHVRSTLLKSDFQADVDILPTDRLVTLATCVYDSEDARFILVGVIR